MKGISLQQMKEQLEGDAQRRCEAQEKTIKDLHYEIKMKDVQIEKHLDTIRVLQNRCFAQTHGVICIFCEYRHECRSNFKNTRGAK